MKGIVFTEFLDFVEAGHGADPVENVIEEAALLHGGAYTAVGTYQYTEMGALVGALARRTGVGAPELLKAFGHHLCRRYTVKYPEFFEAQSCRFDFLASVDNHNHVEVHKLYPDAELPRFRVTARRRLGSRLFELPCARLAGRGHDHGGGALPRTDRHRELAWGGSDLQLRSLLDPAWRLRCPLPSSPCRPTARRVWRACWGASSGNARRASALELAERDQLTGLANRARFARVLEAAIERARTGERFALFLIDLDRFKDINDTLGHEAGDVYLSHVAAQLRKVTPGADVVARLGGDEFAANVPVGASRHAAHGIAEALIATIRTPVAYRDRLLEASASIVIALFPNDALAARDLQRHADIALYRSKESRSTYTLFDLAMMREIEARQSPPTSAWPCGRARSRPGSSRSSTARRERRSASRRWPAGTIRPAASSAQPPSSTSRKSAA